MRISVRTVGFGIACWVAVAGAVKLPAADLKYHFSPGEAFTWKLDTVAKPPTGGDVVTTLSYAFKAQTAGDPANLSMDVSGSSNQVTVGNSTGSFDLGAYGEPSNLQSPQLNDPVNGAFVKNAPGLFIRLPSGGVQVGQSWTQQLVMYLPKTDMPGAFTSMRTVTTYVYKGTQTQANGKVLHLIESKTVEAANQPAKVALDTKTWFDAELGRIVKSDASGTLKVKAGFLWITVPTTYKMVEVGGEEQVD